MSKILKKRWKFHLLQFCMALKYFILLLDIAEAEKLPTVYISDMNIVEIYYRVENALVLKCGNTKLCI